MKVYLAGKMDAEHGAWRDAILGTAYHYELKRYVPRWEAVATLGEDYEYEDDLDVGLGPNSWPTTPNRHVLGLHEYVGPYRRTFAPVEPDSKHSGYFHGFTGKGEHGVMTDEQRERVVRLCRYAIGQVDFVFAYLNSPDCFGTLAEIGYALALSKYVAVVVAEEATWDFGDYWFIDELVASFEYDAPEGRREGESEGERARQYFMGALVQWTGATRITPAMASVPSGTSSVAREAAQSFSQIARWSADPRVRDEAQRMLRRITG
jgi:hypothetical protein